MRQGPSFTTFRMVQMTPTAATLHPIQSGLREHHDTRNFPKASQPPRTLRAMALNFFAVIGTFFLAAGCPGPFWFLTSSDQSDERGARGWLTLLTQALHSSSFVWSFTASAVVPEGRIAGIPTDGGYGGDPGWMARLCVRVLCCASMMRSIWLEPLLASWPGPGWTVPVLVGGVHTLLLEGVNKAASVD